MKLCYIWVDDYKGFFNQGFNLQTEYFFDYSIYDNYLTINKNQNYIKNFFGNDILDIIGIIGKNSSGKTNILELIQYVIDGGKTTLNTPFFVVIEVENRFVVYTHNFEDIKSNFHLSNEKYENKIPMTTSIFFSNVFDGRKHHFGKNIINLSTNNLLNNQFGENVTTNYQKNIQQQIKFIRSPEFSILENLDGNNELKPPTVILTSPIWSVITNRLKTFDQKYTRTTGNTIELKIFAESFRKKIRDNKSDNSLKYLSAFLVFIDFVLNRDILEIRNQELNHKEYFQELHALLLLANESDRIDIIFKYFIIDFAEKINDYWKLSSTYKFLNNLNDLDLGSKNDNDEIKEDIGAYSNRRTQFVLTYNNKVGTFLTGYLNSVTGNSLGYSIDWGGISSGHKAYINLFANFHNIRTKDDLVLISIDEGDLYFHPKWQTEFLYKIINILPKLLKNKCQIFLTTHSPFLVSDLPKKNLLFINRRKDGNATLMNNKEIDGETFGGNIGDLYLDAFFMEGKLVSHFATTKIQAIIDKIRNNINSIDENDKIIISEIGDQLIRTQLENLLYEKN